MSQTTFKKCHHCGAKLFHCHLLHLSLLFGTESFLWGLSSILKKKKILSWQGKIEDFTSRLLFWELAFISIPVMFVPPANLPLFFQFSLKLMSQIAHKSFSESHLDQGDAYKGHRRCYMSHSGQVGGNEDSPKKKLTSFSLEKRLLRPQCWHFMPWWLVHWHQYRFQS